MKAVILAGGLGSRLSEETHNKPKPMVEIGGKPILWHIMKIYSSHNIKEFIICCGYKGYKIKEYFKNYSLNNSDVSINIDGNQLKINNGKKDSWKVTLVDTGQKTLTGGRLKRVGKYLKNEELSLINKIEEINHKNSLLSINLDLDYVETLIRERFLFGKKGETIYIIKSDDK